MPDATTKSARRPFAYSCNPDGSLTIHYGKSFKYTLSHAHVQRLLHTFKSQTLPLGTSRHNPREGSLGHWLQAHVTKSAIASYLGPILVAQGHASWAPNSGKALMLHIH